MRYRNLLLVLALSASSLYASDTVVPADVIAKFHPVKAPETSRLLLKRGDKLAIIGDSITEQKMYSRMMETYHTVCVPQFDVTVRQYGWSGERAPGFLARMTNDCLRFSPTIATTCYGMNDHQYKPYEPKIGETYRETSLAIIRAFKQAGVRVVQGSPGCVGKMPSWVKTASGDVDDLNLSLCELRNIGATLAREEKVAFADIFWPMITMRAEKIQQYGKDFAVPGKDGVHPGWAGQTVMAYAFLKAMGLDGNIGTFTVDMRSNRANVSAGHEVVSFKNGELQIKSSRYPFCAGVGDVTKDNNIRAGMALVPFNKNLNRLKLVVKNAPAKCKVTWGNTSRNFTGDQLTKGVNLAEEFLETPFDAAFKKVDDAVGAKQNFETKQIKQVFHDLIGGKYKSADQIKDQDVKEFFGLRGSDGKFDREALVKATEAKRAPLADAIKTAFVPVTHSIQIVAE